MTPEMHFDLNYKVIFGALIFVCGAYYFGYAFRNITTLPAEAGVAYLITGMSLIATGVIISFAYGFTSF